MSGSTTLLPFQPSTMSSDQGTGHSGAPGVQPEEEVIVKLAQFKPHEGAISTTGRSMRVSLQRQGDYPARQGLCGGEAPS